LQSQKFVGAGKIEGQLGVGEFHLDDDRLSAIKEIAALVKTPDRPVPTGPFVAPPPPPKPKSADEIAREQEDQGRDAARREEEFRRQEEARRGRQAAQLRARLDQKLRLARALERRNTKAALQYYKEIVELGPGLPQAKAAAERIRALAPRE